MKTIRITKATLIENGKPVASRNTNIVCHSEKMEETRERIKSEMVADMTKDVELDLQYQEIMED